MLSEGTSLLSLVAALIGVTVLLGGAVVIVEVAFLESDRDSQEQVIAEGYSDQLLEAAAIETGQSNIIDSDELGKAVNATTTETGEYRLHVSLGEQTLTDHDQIPAEGASVSRLVLVADQRLEQTGSTVTVPAGVPTSRIQTASGDQVKLDGTSTTVETPETVMLDPATETTIVTEGSLTVTYPRIDRQPRQLTVTVEPIGKT